MAESALRSKLLAKQETNYQELRISRGLRLGSQFKRQPPTAWRNSRGQAPTGISVVEPLETVRSKKAALPLTDKCPEGLTLTGEAGGRVDGSMILPVPSLAKQDTPSIANLRPGQIKRQFFFKKHNYKFTATVNSDER